MKIKSLSRLTVLAAVSLLAGFCLPTPSRADTGTVLPGWDLLQTTPGEFTFDDFTADGVTFQGDPLGTFNFGAAAATYGSPSPYIGPSGSVPTGNTDTIVQRLNTVNTPGTIALQIDALQLVSTTPAFGGQYGYITLNPSDLSLDTGTMSMNSTGPDTFNSVFDVYYDVWVGAIDGTLYSTGEQIISDPSGTWTHAAPSGALLIPGVNYELNGVDTSQDFWPGATPEPATLALLAIAGGFSALRVLRGTIARHA